MYFSFNWDSNFYLDFYLDDDWVYESRVNFIKDSILESDNQKLERILSQEIICNLGTAHCCNHAKEIYLKTRLVRIVYCNLRNETLIKALCPYMGDNDTIMTEKYRDIDTKVIRHEGLNKESEYQE